MTVTKKKKGRRGPPSKHQQRKNKLDRMQQKLIDAVLTCDEMAISNYSKYLKVLDDAAQGKLKNQSTTNQISCAKIMKEHCEDILVKAELDEEEHTTEQTEVEAPVSLISLVAEG